MMFIKNYTILGHLLFSRILCFTILVEFIYLVKQDTYQS